MDLDHPSAPYRRGRSLSLPERPVCDAGGGFPTPAEMRRWNLPPGAVIVAADATVVYPGGRTVTWGELRRSNAV